MKKILLSLSVLVSFTFLSLETVAFTDEDLAEINENLEGLSVDELLERREFLIAQLDTDEGSNALDCAGVLNGAAVLDEEGNCEAEPSDKENDTSIERQSILAEISIIEAMLAVLGIAVIDNALSDDDKDTCTCYYNTW